MHCNFSLRSHTRIVACTLLLSCLCWLAGCGNSVKLYPVEGKVTLDSKPLTGGRIILSPDRDKGNQLPYELSGEVNRDGVYHIETEHGKGAPAGIYNVMIVEPLPTSNLGGAVQSIPKRYRDAKESGLHIDVGEKSAPGSYNLELKSDS